MLAGGGTAGHVYPLFGVLSELARMLAERGLRAEACWIGSERIESRIVPRFAAQLAASGSPLKLEFRQIDIRFSWRRPTPNNWAYYLRHILPIVLGRPFRQAQAAFDSFRPQLVLAAGGYVSAPSLQAALRRSTPYALLQLDDPPGLVNNWYAPQAWRIFCASARVAQGFSGRCSAGKLAICGYPAQLPQRSPAEVRKELGLRQGEKLLIAMAGSLGAGAIRRLVRETAASAASNPDPLWRDLAILDVGGERDLQSPADTGPSTTAGPRLIPWAYLEDSMGALAAADFYLGRSGAATVGELISAGIPALLIPDPQHPDRQQFGNAQALIERGQGVLLTQQQANGAAVLDWLCGAWNQARLSAPQPSAASSIAGSLMEFLEDKHALA